MVLSHYLAELVDRVLEANTDVIRAAADAIATTGRADGLAHTTGAGHSLAAVLETFFRAGGLAFVNPLWDLELLPLQGARGATETERVPGSGRSVAEAAGIEARDTVIVFSNSGVNPYPVEVAEVGKEIGATVIAMTSPATSRVAVQRSGRRLMDIADIVIDTFVIPGEVTYPPDSPVTAPTSTLATTAVWAEILCRVVDQWPEAPFWRSANIPGNDERNAATLERYSKRIRAI